MMLVRLVPAPPSCFPALASSSLPCRSRSTLLGKVVGPSSQQPRPRALFNMPGVSSESPFVPFRGLGFLSSSISARTWVPKHSDFEACANAFDRGSSASSFDSKRSCPLTILWFGPCTTPEPTLVAFRQGDWSYAHQPLHTPQLPRRGLHGYWWRKWRPLSSCYLVHSTTEFQVLRSPAFRASSRLIRFLKLCSAESGAHIVDPISTSRTWT